MKLTSPIAVAALVLATLGATGQRYANEFVFDDVHVIEDGSVIHDPDNLFAIWTRHTMFAAASDPGAQPIDTYRPVPITLFVIDAQISGRAPWAYHTTNLLLHLACVLGVFFLALRWLEDRWAALYGALVFALHPWAVEAHVWINGRSDPACLALGLGAMLALLSAERGRRPWAWRGFATALLGLGLLSKETLLLVFPAILLMPAAPGTTRSWRGRLVPLAISAVGYLGARVAVLDGMRTHRDGAMLGDAARNLPWLLADALRETVAPSRPYLRSLRDEYAQVATWQIGLAALAVGLVVVIAWRARDKAPVAAWSALWFFAPLLPIAVISTVLWPGFGRYLYVPLAGFAWALAALVPHVRERVPRRAIRMGLAGLHVAGLAALAGLYTTDFASSERLYAEAIRARPDIAMGHGWLGMARLHDHDARHAVGPLLRAAELDPETHRYLAAAGRALVEVGDREGVERVARRGIERFHDRPEEAAYQLLALNAMTARDPAVAVGHLVRCLEVWPGRPDCAEALASMLRDAPDRAANRAALDAILRQRPELAPLVHSARSRT
ncbi:MAG: glycosyltransferase family 39 protein [Sandaracinaceae bacterium]|nr:glycosyltransferase family 39 protein [Sandaracinaceae bacterium]